MRKPQLEIYADDVQCAHGCTTGELDEEALFYLRSRGISEKNARAILVEGFLNEAFSGIQEQTILNVFHKKIRDWMVI
jgi:Fe-S cluster assembly protein SufD